MNSPELQKKFPEVYKDFFSKTDLVVSGCFSFPWGPRSVANAPHRLILKSCLPIRCYVGLKERSDDKIVFEDMVINMGSEKGFEIISTEIILKEIDKIIEPLKVFLSEQGIHKGYSVYVLSEIGKGHSLGFTGTFSTILATLFLLITKGISEQTLDSNENFMLSADKEKIFRLAWQWELPLRKGRTYGQTIMHTLSGQSVPTLFTTGANSEIITLDQAISSPVYFSDFHDIAPECDKSFEIPFEYALIFSGTISETFKLEGFREADIRNSNSLTNFVQERIFPDIPTSNLYYKNLLEKTSPYIYFSDALGILNTETIKKFHELFLSGYNKTLLETFFEHINHLRELLSIMEPQNDFANEFIKAFHQEKSNQEETIGIFPMYSGKLGGGYLIGLKPGISRDTLVKTCNKMKGCYPRIEIDYFSATDGNDTSSIKIEQDTQSDHFSSFVSKGQVRFLDNMGNSILGDYRTLLSEKREGILFDTIARKIYYKNERLTSGDVPSQTTLTDIINILIDRIGEDVEHTTFPHSSYMKNKNEMLGKIVIPLIRFLEKHTGLILPLVCKGELGSFYLKLENTPIPIGVLRRM